MKEISGFSAESDKANSSITCSVFLTIRAGKLPKPTLYCRNAKDEKGRSQTSIFEKTTVNNEGAGHFFDLSRNAFKHRFETTNLSRMIEHQLTDKGMSFWPDTISALTA